MLSEEARLQTALSRLVDAGVNVKAKAAQSSELSGSQAQSLDRQRSETDQSAAAISQMAATIQEVTQNVISTAHAASEADQLTRDGSELARQSLSAMKTMREEVSEIGLAVNAGEANAVDRQYRGCHHLHCRTDQPARRSTLPSKRRAGEQGRGFAVVADECAPLANAPPPERSTASLLRCMTVPIAVSTANRGEQISREACKVSRRCSGVGRHQPGPRITGMSQRMASASEEQITWLKISISRSRNCPTVRSQRRAGQARRGDQRDLEVMTDYLQPG